MTETTAQLKVPGLEYPFGEPHPDASWASLCVCREVDVYAFAVADGDIQPPDGLSVEDVLGVQEIARHRAERARFGSLYCLVNAPKDLAIKHAVSCPERANADTGEFVPPPPVNSVDDITDEMTARLMAEGHEIATYDAYATSVADRERLAQVREYDERQRQALCAALRYALAHAWREGQQQEIILAAEWHGLDLSDATRGVTVPAQPVYNR